MKIGTHDGTFHCDEALGCFLLKLLPRYKDAEIVRSRDQSILDTCDIVIDVGHKYDPSTHRYDHHMSYFKESISTVIKKPGYDCTIKLSSAGLVYCHFGHEILRELVPKEISDEDVENIFKRIYNTLIKEVDAIDNGIPPKEGELLYTIVTDLSSRVDRLNSPINQENVNPDEQFAKAVALAGEEFLYFVHHSVNVWLPAKSYVKDCLMKRFEVDPSGEIMILENYVNALHHLFTLEEELNIKPTLKYIIFGEGNKDYRIRAVPICYGNMALRIPLPEPWRGRNGEELSKVCGVEGAIFVHAAGFIGGHKTKEGALAMACKSLELAKST